MDDSLAVRGVQRIEDLACVEQCAHCGQRAPQRFAFHKFHDQVIGSHIVERCDVRMIQRGGGAGFAREPVRELLARGLEGHDAVEPPVTGFKDFAHPTGADGAENFVGPEAAFRGRHEVVLYIAIGRRLRSCGPCMTRIARMWHGEAPICHQPYRIGVSRG